MDNKCEKTGAGSNFPHLSDAETQLDTKRLSEAVIELNILRKNVAIYPPGHAQINRSVDRAYAILNEMASIWPRMTLGVAKDTLMVGEKCLDRKNPVFREFAFSLNQREIAAVTFVQGLTKEELVAFHRILTTKPQEIASEGGIEKAVSGAQIHHIIIQPLDYSGLHLTEEKEIICPQEKAEDSNAGMWQDFVSHLLSGTLDSSAQGVLPEDSFHTNPAELARFLNENKLDVKVALQSYDKVMAEHVRDVTERNHWTSEQSTTLVNLNNLIQDLKPNLRKQFLSVASRHLSSQKQSSGAEKLFEGFTDDMVIEMISLANEEGREISPTLIGLIQNMSSTLDDVSPDSGDGSAFTSGEVSFPDIPQEHIQKLFEREDYENTVPSDYDSILKNLKEGRVLEEINPAEAFPIDDYIESLDDSRLDFQTGRALLAFLEEDIDDEDYEEFLNKLLSLLPQFLENGDFSLLLDVFETLRSQTKERLLVDLTVLSEGAEQPDPAQKIIQKSERVRELASGALSIFSEPDFVSKAISAFDKWANTKGQEASDFLQAALPYSVPGLIELYANDKNLGGRRVLFKLLVEFGEAAVSEAQRRLNDTRTHFVRNLLMLIRRVGTPKVLPYVKPLLKRKDQGVWIEVLSTLLRFRDPLGTLLLRKSLRSRNKKLSSQAIFLAGKYRQFDVAQDLVSMLNKRPLLKSSYTENEEIIKALGYIGNECAIPILEKLARSRWPYYPESRLHMQVVLFESLGSYPQESIKELLHIGNKSEDFRIRMACGKLLMEARTATEQNKPARNQEEGMDLMNVNFLLVNNERYE